jgi:hypothetical protein
MRCRVRAAQRRELAGQGVVQRGPRRKQAQAQAQAQATMGAGTVTALAQWVRGEEGSGSWAASVCVRVCFGDAALTGTRIGWWPRVGYLLLMIRSNAAAATATAAVRKSVGSPDNTKQPAAICEAQPSQGPWHKHHAQPTNSPL